MPLPFEDDKPEFDCISDEEVEEDLEHSIDRSKEENEINWNHSSSIEEALAMHSKSL